MLVYDEAKNLKALYLTNQFGQKLLKIVVNSEAQKTRDTNHAQIKIVTYGIKRAWIWRDLPSDPDIVTLRDGIDLTYHGGPKGDQAPKVHVKITMGRYVTLIDDSLRLPTDVDYPVPLFSFETGHANQRELTDPVVKPAHVIGSGSNQAVRFDLYLAGATLDMGAFVNSVYFMNLFWTQEYLAAVKRSPLISGQIVAPIAFFSMGQYRIVVRRSLSNYAGRPRLHFYNNKNYYEKLMSRRTATPNPDGTLSWSTMAEDEARLRAIRQSG